MLSTFYTSKTLQPFHAIVRMSDLLIDELVGLIQENRFEDLSLLLTQESEENKHLNLLKSNPLETLRTACIIPGRSQFVDLLINTGADVTSCSTAGYTALHLAACWGVVPALRSLVRLGADLNTQTVNSETAEDIARRYGQEEVLKFFSCLALQKEFQEEIAYTRSIVLSPENFTGKLSKEEKTRITKVCDEKTSWLDTNYSSTSIVDVTEQRKDFKSKLSTVLDKVQPIEQV